MYHVRSCGKQTNVTLWAKIYPCLLHIVLLQLQHQLLFNYHTTVLVLPRLGFHHITKNNPAPILHQEQTWITTNTDIQSAVSTDRQASKDVVTYITDRHADIRLIKQAAPVPDFFLSERPDT